LFLVDKDTKFYVGIEMKERLYVLYLLFRNGGNQVFL